MRRLQAYTAFAALIFAAALFLYGCTRPAEPSPPEPEPAPREEAEAPETSAGNPLDGLVMIGNSCLLSLRDYGVIKDVPIYAKVGLTVSQLLDYQDPASGKTMREILREGGFRKVLVMVGENELGWNASAFAARLQETVAEIQACNPEMAVCLHAITPISRAASEKGEYGATREHIDQFNEKIRAVAASCGAQWLDPAPVLADEEGYLPAGASADGIHLEPQSARVWGDYLIRHIDEGGEKR